MLQQHGLEDSTSGGDGGSGSGSGSSPAQLSPVQPFAVIVARIREIR